MIPIIILKTYMINFYFSIKCIINFPIILISVTSILSFIQFFLLYFNFRCISRELYGTWRYKKISAYIIFSFIYFIVLSNIKLSSQLNWSDLNNYANPGYILASQLWSCILILWIIFIKKVTTCVKVYILNFQVIIALHVILNNMSNQKQHHDNVVWTINWITI